MIAETWADEVLSKKSVGQNRCKNGSGEGGQLPPGRGAGISVKTKAVSWSRFLPRSNDSRCKLVGQSEGEAVPETAAERSAEQNGKNFMSDLLRAYLFHCRPTSIYLRVSHTSLPLLQTSIIYVMYCS